VKVTEGHRIFCYSIGPKWLPISACFWYSPSPSYVSYMVSLKSGFYTIISRISNGDDWIDEIRAVELMPQRTR